MHHQSDGSRPSLDLRAKVRRASRGLEACCKQCHEFIHAKSDADPALDRPIVLPWRGEAVKSFYLAGKITGTTWRETIVPKWSEENGSNSYYEAHYETHGRYCENAWSVVMDACNVLGANLHYTGPWWKDQSCHGWAGASRHPHGYGSGFEGDVDLSEIDSRRVQVSDAVQEIGRAHV